MRAGLFGSARRWWVTAATMVMDDVADTVLAWLGDDEIGRDVRALAR